MKLLNIFIPTLVFAALGCAADDDADEALVGSEYITCETSHASPLMHHIYELIENLRKDTDEDECFCDMLGKKNEGCGPPTDTTPERMAALSSKFAPETWTHGIISRNQIHT